MVGLRGDLFVVGPASSFHHNQHQHDPIHHHHHHHHHSSDPVNNNSNTALGVGVIPLLSASPCNLGLEDAGDHHSNNNSNSNFNGNNRSTNRGLSSGIQLWQNHPSYSLKKSIMFDQNNSLLNPGGGGVLGAGATGTTSTSNTTSSTATCQDCGNQAKKDCSHRRCRTCCKSRGYDCSTHVKSTWVPAARRRERQLSSAAAAAAAAAGSSGSTSGVKKPRLITSQTTTSHTSTSNSFDTSSSHQDASFREALPGQVRAPAVFKCVRVTAIEDGEDEYAYQAVVKIGGHVFKGFLYDQGVDGREGFPNISELHLGASSGGPSVGGGGRNGASSSPIMDPSDVYAASSAGGLLGGTAFGNPIN